ncbi:hypothetical protein POTOM_037254 [Populus tomentosa]|uniref:FLZ-type domain-containing protein n=1 Tax=Populus tomentosa TaxID=118781 RepID=A0A8X7Z4Y1_POPTO|nr:hypothetical protein POTOM_037254 [Populus tomentosa]
MVGLSIVLETPESGSTLQVINKVTMMINSKPTSPPGLSSSRNRSPRFSFPVPTFLDQCFFCGQKLLPGKDIYMYKSFVSSFALVAFCNDIAVPCRFAPTGKHRRVCNYKFLGPTYLWMEPLGSLPRK